MSDTRYIETQAMVREMAEKFPKNTPSAELNQAFENLLQHLLETYPEDTTQDEVGKVFASGLDFGESLTPGVVPILAMRTVLSGYKLSPQMHEVPSWPKFVRRYIDVILPVGDN